jgi:hypothetical protein
MADKVVQPTKPATGKMPPLEMAKIITELNNKK